MGRQIRGSVVLYGEFLVIWLLSDEPQSRLGLIVRGSDSVSFLDLYHKWYKCRVILLVLSCNVAISYLEFNDLNFQRIWTILCQPHFCGSVSGWIILTNTDWDTSCVTILLGSFSTTWPDCNSLLTERKFLFKIFTPRRNERLKRHRKMCWGGLFEKCHIYQNSGLLNNS